MQFRTNLDALYYMKVFDVKNPKGHTYLKSMLVLQ